VTKPDPGVDDESTRQERNNAAGIGMALDLGVRLGVSVFLGLGAGLLLDNWLHTSPIFTLIGMVVGIAAAMYTIWDVARDAMRR
jgi:F0F1-type ATP synthase assembly protein I